MNGTTRKQQNMQGQKRVDCLKVDKRRKWVRYLTNHKDITMTEAYNSERLHNMDIIHGKIHHNAEASIMMTVNPKKEWMACKKTHYLSLGSCNT